MTVSSDVIFQFDFFALTARAASSWILATSLVVKVASTLYGLRQRAVGRLTVSTWWCSKLSALILCLAAVALAAESGNSSAAIAFSLLFVAASFAVVGMARRRAATSIKPLS